MITLVLTFAIVILAAIIQGMTSFGFSLIAIPLLSMILPLKTFVPMIVLFSFLMNATLFKFLKGHFDKKRILILVISGLLSTTIGIRLLSIVDNELLKMVVGIILIISGFTMMFGFKIKWKSRLLGDFIAGIVSGVLNGSVSLSGPPVILLLSNEGTNKDDFRKTLTSFFLLLNLLSLPIFFVNGLLTDDVLLKSIVNLPALGFGIYFGLKLGKKISEQHFRKVTISLIILMGVMSLTSSII